MAAGAVQPDVRSEILVAATRLFAARGVDGTSLQQIADVVGVRKASLLYHFPSKDELHRRVLEQLLSRWNETLPRLLSAAARQDRFDAVLEETLAFFLADPDRARLLLREALDRPAEMRQLLRRYVAPWLAVVAEVIRGEQRSGSIRPEVDAEAYVLQVIHLLIGTVSAAGATATLLGGRGARGEARLLSELRRVARASLLVHAGHAAAGTTAPGRNPRTKSIGAGGAAASKG